MPGRGPSKSISRLNEDLRRKLVEIVDAMKDPRLKGGLVTVTRVETAQDLTQAKVYVSVLAGKRSPDALREVLAALHSARGHVRSELAARVHIRRTPELHFIGDDGAAYAAHINEMLKELKP